MSVINQSAAVMGFDRPSTAVAAVPQNDVPQTPTSQTASLFNKLSLPDRQDYSSRINSMNAASSSLPRRPQLSSGIEKSTASTESNYATALERPVNKHSEDVDDSDDSLQGSVSSLQTVSSRSSVEESTEKSGTGSSVQRTVTAGAAALSPPQQRIMSSSTTTTSSQPLHADATTAASSSAAAHAALQLSLLYPDTAPRTTWRPQLNAWMKKNHPSILKEISQSTATAPVSVPPARSHSISTNHNYLLQRKDHHLHNPNHHAKRPIHEPVKPYARPEEPRLPSPPGSPDLYSPATAAAAAAAAQIANGPPSPPHTASPKSPQLRDEPQYTISTFVVAGYNMQPKRCCISCGSDQSPCWRPSWSVSAGQLCNSCGLRYKKTGARCVSSECGRIPAKGEWVTMKRNAVMGDDGALQYSCLTCGGDVEVGERND